MDLPEVCHTSCCWPFNTVTFTPSLVVPFGFGSAYFVYNFPLQLVTVKEKNTEDQKFLDPLPFSDCKNYTSPKLSTHDYLSPVLVKRLVTDTSRSQRSIEQQKSLGEIPTPSSTVVHINSGNLEFYKGLLISHCNVNGIKSKFEEIRELLIIKRFLFFGIGETKLEVSDVLFPISIPGYNHMKMDSVRCGGGLVFYVNQSVSFEILNLPKSVKFPNESEIVVAKLYIKGLKPLLIVLLYNNPKDSKLVFINALCTLLSYFQTLQLEFIILRDFNIDLLGADTHTSALYNMMKEFNLSQVIKSATRRSVTKVVVTKTLLDHIYLSKQINFGSAGHAPFGGSNHDLTFLTLKRNRVRLQPSVVSFRSFRNVDWVSASKQFDLINFDFLVDECNLDIAFHNFRKKVVEFIDDLAPVKSKTIRGVRRPWFDSEVRTLVAVRDRLSDIKDAVLDKASLRAFRRARNKVTIVLNIKKKPALRHLGTRRFIALLH